MRFKKKKDLSRIAKKHHVIARYRVSSLAELSQLEFLEQL